MHNRWRANRTTYFGSFLTVAGHTDCPEVPPHSSWATVGNDTAEGSLWKKPFLLIPWGSYQTAFITYTSTSMATNETIIIQVGSLNISKLSELCCSSLITPVFSKPKTQLIESPCYTCVFVSETLSVVSISHGPKSSCPTESALKFVHPVIVLR